MGRSSGAATSYNGGRYLDTQLSVTENGFSWGYRAGPLKVSNTMRLTESGEWEEITMSTYGSNPAMKSVEMTLTKQR
ncbi:MAG: hypothetical protein JSU00_30615 [Acidobacteria bacterium]|nr:hypothetical protein [Acidobacteriota bacterium]